ncbi:6,7-dimethyl-8-ribityllumazine synthase [Phaeovibrio sulfidiphilus]|uniref:6,7-dimethyl-8-ribityllumazine synthase n=1 Tax=Phaeovibrio sulfidiphilus TaxID=1220600 RepID=A0A8J6YYD8_9PROT|nr:6,7-dimethyl-8-ribityllumazine synthase [Phaeovibrio sulfidiphilus]MBE1236818.1 6,7-dimethyl-8-ribityllumazine synthase [Phaeovibrio sulfidiphilus]
MSALAKKKPTRVFIIEARFYDDISDLLVKGAIEALERAGVVYERLSVPGILEIPAVVQYVSRSQFIGITYDGCDGFVVLGCAIKGKTDHYEHVSRVCFDALGKLTLAHSLAIGNGILTCPNLDLALERADPAQRNYGGRAAEACLRLIDLKRALPPNQTAQKV